MTPGVAPDSTAAGEAELLAAMLADQLGVREPLPVPAVTAAVIHPRYHRQLVMARDQPAALAQLLAAPPRVSAAAAASLGLVPPPRPGAESSSALARRATTAAVRWAASGFALADQATREARLAACAACPHRTGPSDWGAHKVTRKLKPASKICGLCGCVTDLKVRLASEACPAPHPTDPALTRWGEPRMQPAS